MYPVILSGCEQLYDPPCTPIYRRTQLIVLRCSLTVVSTPAMPALSQIKPDAHLGVLAWGPNACTSGGVSLIGFPQAWNVKLASLQVCKPSFGCILFAVPPGGHHIYLTSTLLGYLIFRYLDSYFKLQHGLDLLQSWHLQHPPRRSLDVSLRWGEPIAVRKVLLP